ncbi:hypothetical protein CEH05_17045 [Halobacillus halophilus]|uniref:Uncharacterized protein n=1 Tax=Halobacillus halophilus (strain ATCC 35676 / DSM 2266 / JCM 20832 / KCTC 3685 / LMG 17431 / NBRC 102448 / NCIMB 2269) TaxID=866895 RepID=I0JRN1_HALH3|nr:hypothetical protein [Halobacillus halophilus]ASF40769.1 hypothetical protein CEH05_17045 [Halobacillus halophilus]CCG46802.1 hypothetical protein HBHAL_4462 [Halobacillus halophilus DSM 2266]
MSDFHLFVLVALLLTVISSFLLTRKWCDFLSHSQRMVMSMFSGTTIGLTVGLMASSIFPGSFYSSNLIGFFGGATLAALSTGKLGTVSMMEGLTAGMMGGMMGAMLGEMVSYTEAVIFLQLLITLSISSLLLYPVFFHASFRENSIPTKRWLIKPFLVFLAALFILLGGSLLDSAPASEPPTHQTH